MSAKVNFDLSSAGCNALAVSGSNLFASLNNMGIFLLDKADQKWIDCRGPFLFANMDIIGNYIFTGSLLGAGIGYTTVSNFITSVKALDNSPNSFNLCQNYPNPFNPTTTIKYSLPTGRQEFQTVQLKVYDILGREITTLVNQKQKPGNYEVNWNGSEYSSGVYFYKLKVDNYTSVKKMMMTK